MLPAGLEPLNPELKQGSDHLGPRLQSNNTRRATLLSLLSLGRGYAVGMPSVLSRGETELTPVVHDGQRSGLLSGWEGRWFDHQELKDDRCEAFTAYLAPGIYEYTYLTRATTVGVFIAPPSKARRVAMTLISVLPSTDCVRYQVEEMYSPGTFGRGTTDIVHVYA